MSTYTIILDLLLFCLSLFVLVKSAEFCIKYASKLARNFHVSEFIISFFVVAVISTFPETAVSVVSSMKGIPEFGLATLLGSNVADLTLVFGIVVLFSKNGIPIKSQVLKESYLYLFLLAFPIILGFDGYFSRSDGVLLIIGGLFFFFTLLVNIKKRNNEPSTPQDYVLKNSLWLILSLVVIFMSANYVVQFGTRFAQGINIPQIVIGLVFVSLGTCMPELFVSIRSVKTNHEGLALGDLLGTVIIDATIIIGLLAVMRPFYFPPTLAYLTGFAMFLAGVMVIYFIKKDKIITKKEGIALICFYFLFMIAEFLLNK